MSSIHEVLVLLIVMDDGKVKLHICYCTFSLGTLMCSIVPLYSHTALCLAKDVHLILDH